MIKRHANNNNYNNDNVNNNNNINFDAKIIIGSFFVAIFNSFQKFLRRILDSLRGSVLPPKGNLYAPKGN